MTTSILFATVDGFAARSEVTEEWATIRAGVGNTVLNDGVHIDIYGEVDSNGDWVFLGRGLTIFDTSSIPDTDTITSATLAFYCTSKSDQSGQSVHISSGTTASPTALAEADYQANQGTDASFGSLPITSITVGQYNSFILNAAGIGNISKTGLSKFALRLAGDLTNVEPAVAAGGFVSVRFQTFLPRLTIVHESTTTTRQTDGKSF